MWDEDSAAASEAMVRHDQILDAIIDIHRGQIVRPRGEGDSRFAVFQDPIDAVAASVEIQKAIVLEDWSVSIPFRIRIAIHSGSGTFRDGDYYGPEVNRCARIRALAHGGQILISAVTRNLVGSKLHAGTKFVELGTFQLKGLREPEQIFQLVIDGLQNEYPPLKISETPFETPPLEQHIQFATAPDGVALAYATSGSGPPIVKAANWLNHLEFDWQSPIWRHWLLAFSQNHQLLRYDERGTGLSDWDAENLTFESWVTDLETVVDAAGLDQFPLVGLSQGGAVSLEYAYRHPERITHLILYGSYLKGWRHRSDTPGIIREREALITLTESGWGKENPAYRQVFTSRFMPEATAEQMRWFNDLQRNTTSPGNAVILQEVTAEIDVSQIAPLIKVPTLVMHAREDGSIPFEEGRQLASLIPGARFVSLESKNHILLESEPAWRHFLQEFFGFLDEPR